MVNTDVIIVGAGASGLMAAKQLSKAGLKVIVLEARERSGGRIHTLNVDGFDTTAEAGAEFIHGNLPVTIDVLKEAGITYHMLEGQIWRSRNGKFMEEEEFVEDWELLARRLKELKNDVTMEAFLDQYFSEHKYEALKDSVKGFIEGYDAGDITKASAFAFREDLSGMEDSEQYRINGGYQQLIKFLEDESKAAGCRIYFSTIVNKINWRPDHVEVISDNHQSYIAKKVVVTVPLGVLQAGPGSLGGIEFAQALPGKLAAAHSLGFGAVIKILLQFKEAFWKGKHVQERIGIDMANLGWLFTDGAIPTWWTQLPERSVLLTGWLAGPKAAYLKDADEKMILGEALNTLAFIFHVAIEEITQHLLFSRIFNWTSDPFTRGAYAYSTIHTSNAIKELIVPVEDTVYFAGEALHDGPQMATVEGALASGIRVAEQIRKLAD